MSDTATKGYAGVFLVAIAQLAGIPDLLTAAPSRSPVRPWSRRMRSSR